MRAIVWFLMLVGAQGFFIRPEHKQTLDIKRELSSLLRKIRQSSGNCRELSDAFGQLARHGLSLLPYVVASSGNVNVASQERTELFVEMLFGFDSINDDEARETYTCAITQAGSLSELKAALENNNLLHNLFRMLYDSSVIGIQLAKSQNQILHQPMLQFVNAVESVGLLDLDSARVAQLKVMVAEQLGPVLAGYEPTEPFVGSTFAKCAHVNNAFRRFYNTLNLEPMQKAMMQQMIGIDISDNDQMRSFLCNLIDGAEGGVAGLYAVLDSHGIFSSVFRSMYPQLQTDVPLGRATLEQLLQEQVPESAPNNGRSYPGNRGRDPSEPSHAQLIQLLSDAIRFLQALENSSLLSLAIDL